MPKLKLTLTTPEVESKTTNTVKLRELNLVGLLEDNGPLALVSLTEGYQDGETFTAHRSKNVRLEKVNLEAELDKTVVGTDTVRQALERAIFAALLVSDSISAGSIS